MQRLTIERLMFVTLFALLFAMATRVPVDTDTWWHIRSGEYTLDNGMIYRDPFSWTKQGEPWTNHSWGSQIILYGVWSLAGDVGLALYTAVLATAGMAFVYAMCSGHVYLRAFALILGATTAAVFWSPRPQMMSFLFSAVVLYLLWLYKWKKVDRLWLIPPIMLVWGNLHAGFSIGFIFMGGVIAGEVLGNLFNRGGEQVVSWRGIRKLILVALVSVAVLVINPYGFRMLLVPFETLSIGALRDYIQEWNSPNFQGRQTWPFIFLLLGLLGAVGASRRRLDWTDFVLVSGTAFMALLAGRNISVFAVAATPVFTRHVDALLQEQGWVLRPVRRVSRRQAQLNAVLLVVILIGALAVVVSVLTSQTVEPAQARFLPIAAADHIREENLTGRMFNSYNWGGYLMFALPDLPVYVDGRTDLYKDEFLLRYIDTAVGARGWRETLAEDGIEMVVIEAQSGLADVLRDEPGWRLDYEDDLAVIFLNENPT
ncbi:MAG: hypothetical protein SF029_05025 [bacterium]|nr:hypothetical protein [bacterium]